MSGLYGRKVTKGINFTEVETPNSVQFWQLKKNRNPEDCGVWVNGLKIKEYNEMFKVKVKNNEVS